MLTIPEDIRPTLIAKNDKQNPCCVWADFPDGSGYRMAEPGYVVETEVSKTAFVDMQMLAHRWNCHDDLIKALEDIAAYEDEQASKRLKETGSYGAFDEPGSVQIARETLERLKIAKAEGR